MSPSMGTLSPIALCSAAVRGNSIPKACSYTQRVNPEQSKPDGVVPPYT